LLRRKRRRAGGAFEEFEASGRVLLACRGCAERVVLLGREDDRREEGRPTFACCGCGRVLTFADSVGPVRPGPSGPARGTGAGMGEGPRRGRYANPVSEGEAPVLPPGYSLDLVGDPCVVVLRRGDGTIVARFSDHAAPEEIRRAAEEDRRQRPHEA
jgi:hypothetical protein